MGLEYGFDRGMGCQREKLPVPEKLLHLERCQGKKWYFLGHTNFVPKPTHPYIRDCLWRLSIIGYDIVKHSPAFKWCKAVDRRSTFPSSAWNLGGDLEFDLAFFFVAHQKSVYLQRDCLKNTHYFEHFFFPLWPSLLFVRCTFFFLLAQKKTSSRNCLMITSGTGHWRNDGFGTHMVFPAVLKQEIWHRNLHPSRNGLLAFIQRLETFGKRGWGSMECDDLVVVVLGSFF